MNLNYSELKESVKLIRSNFIFGDTWRFGKIQKAYSSGNIVILNIRIPGETIYLAIGRGGEHCGLWKSTEQIPSEYRIVRDQFLEYIRSNLIGKAIVDIKCDDLDKIISIEFSDKSKIFLFWKGRRLFFSSIEYGTSECKEFSPWRSAKRLDLGREDFTLFDEIGRMNLDKKEIDSSKLVIDIHAIHQSNSKSKKIVKDERRIKNIQKDLQNCSLWPEIQEKLINDEFDLIDDRFKFKTYKHKFRPDQNYHHRKDALFQKIKKLKIGEKILIDRLKKMEDSFVKAKSVVEQKVQYPVWSKEIETSTTVVSKDNMKIYEIRNHKFGVGLNTIGNDLLRTKWSSKSDLWLHLDGYKSAHVIIKGEKVNDPEIITIGASILAKYSNYEAREVPIIFTQVSNLKGLKGVSGSVTYKKEKRIIVQTIPFQEIISTSWLE